MASKSTYECFVCKNNGFTGVQVYLAGKDDQGRSIRLESDGVTPHVHKTKVTSQQTQQTQQPARLHDSSDRINCYKDIERQT